MDFNAYTFSLQFGKWPSARDTLSALFRVSAVGSFFLKRLAFPRSQISALRVIPEREVGERRKRCEKLFLFLGGDPHLIPTPSLTSLH